MPPPGDNQRVILLIILLLLWTTTNDNSAGFVQAPSLTRARLARQRTAHGVLNTTHWGDFSPRLANEQPLFPGPEPRYLNLTGFREEDRFAWEDFGHFRNRCEEWSENAVGKPNAASPVWQNVSGVIRGPWIRKPLSVSRTHASYNLSEVTPGIEWIAENADWGRNITGREGKMLVRVHDQEAAGTEPKREDLHPVGQPPLEVKARAVSATVTIDDEEGSGSSSEMRLHGVHWPRQGALLLTTTSEKFAGIFALPHLTSREDYFNSSQALLNRTLDEMLHAKERRYFTDHGNPWASTSDSGEPLGSAPHCEYIFYMQVHPPEQSILDIDHLLAGPENIAKAIDELEYELRFPRGAPQDGPPRLMMSAVVYSPDCAFMIETKGPPDFPPAEGQHLSGWKQEQWLHDVGYWMLGFGAIIFLQVQLLKTQMREASTPSTLGRISFYTASMILLADGIIFAGSAAWALSASNTLLPALVVTGASCLATTVGICFLSEIYVVQEPEWRRRDRERQANSTSSTPRPPPTTPAPDATTPNTSSESNTLLSTAARRATPRPPSPPIIIPSDQDIDAEIEQVTNNPQSILPAPVTAATPANNQNANRSTPLGTIFGHLIMSGIAILFLSLAAATWKPALRSVYFNILALGYLSLWTPQIYRNVYRNCRRALSWRFVIGQSILRILPIAYFYLVKDNFAFATPDWTAFAVLAGWLWIQIWMLAAQNVLGPRFGIPRGWMPEAWEYHPILREDGVESGGLPIGLVLGSSDTAPSSPTLDRTKSGADANKHTRIHHIDCAICREVLEVPVVKAGESDPNSGVTGVFTRRAYMVTPCRHIFHSACLEGWMRFRLQCPICREELPPL
ncbi:hypothetical protein PFICI_07860 [Pestalotiopsis fici W106-1]|uniref:DSC E3 ubiquitin ligase complex subunit A n=1 Tax=Pestalotiopsis fici (strain W106-1 / CGMCC3.15140) TaxID=1229662 RepID=W3X575_PESFW|nr:uncharacterized protein PFICI_07860 [Pestalotiopsis fici W106-1]ETS80331.1 hypothetical protein PFICI_07860 [Pestalotiopsis fici W106-1]